MQRVAWLKVGLLPSLLLLVVSACQTLPGPGPSSPPPSLVLQNQPDRMVVIAVENRPAATVRAGSVPRDYDTRGAYQASDRAEADLDGIAERYQLRVVGAWTIASLKLQCAAYQLPDGADRDEVLAALREDRRVRLAEPLQTFDTQSSGADALERPVGDDGAYNDPYWRLQQGFRQVNAGGAQQWSMGEGVRVAVIDTGMDVTHDDLKGRIATSRNFVDADPAAFSRDRHGTEVAGVIAALANNRQGIVGIAPRVEMTAYKACWQLRPDADAARCNSFTLAEALGAAIESGVQIINLSLAGPADPLLDELLQEALRRRIIVTGAVPPDGRRGGFPTGITGVIAVDRSDRIDADPRILHAPGSDIVTLTPGGHYDFVTGSSFSTAHVTAVAALVLALSPHLDPGAVGSLLSSTSEPAGREGALSINACAALAKLRGESSCEASAAGRAPGKDPSASPGALPVQQP